MPALPQSGADHRLNPGTCGRGPRRGPPSVALLAAVVVAIGLLGWYPSAAAAYSGSSAASWADSHALSTNCSQVPCDTDDCTNFVSLAMHIGGGYPFHYGNTDETNDENWFYGLDGLGGWNQSWSWLYAPDQAAFQILHYPGGTWYGTASGTAGYSFDGLSQGDLLFYDWDGNGSIDHVAIQTVRGYDPNVVGGNQYGDLIDEHSSNRRRVWWTLSPYNPARNTTVIDLMRISSSN